MKLTVRDNIKTTEDAEDTDFIKSIRALCALCSLKTTYYANYT